MNDRSITIARRREPGEFEQLRETMLNAVQRLASHSWTDYNLHDPGVTILEQLCYGLTDLNHRTGYAIEELFANDQHELDLHYHGLYTPCEALTCRPVTHADKIKYLLDAVPALARVNIQATVLTPGEGGFAYELPWLYRLTIHTRDIPVSRTERATICKQVEQCFHRIRNLGEDLFSVTMANDKPLFIEAHVYVDDRVVESSLEAELLARVYRQAQSYLLGEVHFDSHRNANEIDGPDLKSLHISDSALRDAQEARSLTGLIATMNQVPGVKEIDNVMLWERDSRDPESYQPLDLAKYSERDYSLRLQLPEFEGEKSLSLVSNHRKLAWRIDQLKVQFQNLENARRLQRQTASVERLPHTWPSAHRDLHSYVSIQSQFPRNYCINDYGINDYGNNQFGMTAQELDSRKAQAKQLKGYLMLFDQLMNDHLGILDNTKHFFSSDISLQLSYPSQSLNADIVPGVENLYSRFPERDFLKDIEAYDNYPQRKSRVLDFLCAMNGRDREVFGWEFRNPYFSETEKQQRLLKDKQKHLQLLHEHAQNRAGAFNYRQASWGKTNLSYLEKRLRLILGLGDRRLSTVYPLVKRGLTHSEGSLGFHFNPNHENQDSPLATAFYQHIGQTAIENQAKNFVAVPERDVDEQESWKTFHYVKSRAFGHLKNLQDLLFQAGANLDQYRLGQVTSKREIELFINLNTRSQVHANWLYLMSFKSKKEAVLATNQLRFCIQQLNIDMEGVHVLEHNLLLPLDDLMRPSLSELNSLGDAFPESAFFKNYVQQISVLLPSWSARFRDVDFQSYANDLILQDAPAHLYTRIYWLSYSEMEKFEVLFKSWCDEKMQAKQPQKVNLLSGKLIDLITSFEAGSAA